MTKKRTKPWSVHDRWKGMGYKFLGSDDPIYSSGTLILFCSRFVRPTKPVEDATTDKENTDG